MREWERGSWDVARQVVPNFTWDYRGEHPEDAGYDPRLKCRLCGSKLYFHSMKGNNARYACDGIGCANNPDSNWKTKFDHQSVKEIGNPAYLWTPLEPLI